MFERFTDRARRVVVLAQEEARLLDHNYIGTEHILLGLIHEGGGVAAQALRSAGVDLGPAREQVEKIIGRGKKPLSGHIPFTPRAKKVLELSLREALELGDNYIGSEHILLGLLREGEGVAVQIIARLGGDLSQIRQQVIQLRQNEPAEGGPAPRMAVATPLEDVSFQTRRGPRELWLTEFQSSLNKIVDRLDAIERHLGLKRAPAGPAEPRGAPGGTQAAASRGAEADAPAGAGEPGGPDAPPPGGAGESGRPEAPAAGE